MSSAAATQNPTTTNGGDTDHFTTAPISGGGGGSSSNSHQTLTFWCHECDMSVSLLPSPSPSPLLLCPECGGEFLEEMDSLPPPPPPLLHSHSHSHPQTQTLTLTLSDSDNSSSSDPDDPHHPPSVSPQAYFERLLHHLAGGEDNNLPSSLPRGPSPASKSSIASIPTVQISDPSLLCAICKDEFPLHSDAKQLPCSHFYHLDCIIPWLSHHNTCPVCRFLLPAEDPPARRATRLTSRFGNLLEEDDGDEDGGFGRAIRSIARRHRLVFPVRSAETMGSFLTSPTQIAQAEVGSAGPTVSGETVSSGWAVEGESNVGAGGSGVRVDDEGDTVMSEVRRDLFD